MTASVALSFNQIYCLFLCVRRLARGAALPSGMASPLPLKALNKTSGRIAVFTVRTCGGRINSYSYTPKADSPQKNVIKFECWLVGPNAEEYCIGYFRGSEAECKKAKGKYADHCVWSLSMVSLDTWTKPMYISTPVAVRVDLSKSTMTLLDATDIQATELRARMPTYPTPPRTVAETAGITTDKATDLIAIVKTVGSRRPTKSTDEVMDVELIDASRTTAGNLAKINVSVFGKEKLDLLEASQGEPMAFF